LAASFAQPVEIERGDGHGAEAGRRLPRPATANAEPAFRRDARSETPRLRPAGFDEPAEIGPVGERDAGRRTGALQNIVPSGAAKKRLAKRGSILRSLASRSLRSSAGREGRRAPRRSPRPPRGSACQPSEAWCPRAKIRRSLCPSAVAAERARDRSRPAPQRTKRSAGASAQRTTVRSRPLRLVREGVPRGAGHQPISVIDAWSPDDRHDDRRDARGPSNSQRKTFCQVPRRSRPPSTGIVSDGPTRAALNVCGGVVVHAVVQPAVIWSLTSRDRAVSRFRSDGSDRRSR